MGLLVPAPAGEGAVLVIELAVPAGGVLAELPPLGVGEGSHGRVAETLLEGWDSGRVLLLGGEGGNGILGVEGSEGLEGAIPAGSPQGAHALAEGHLIGTGGHW